MFYKFVLVIDTTDHYVKLKFNFTFFFFQELCWLLPTSKTSSQNHKPWLISTLKLLSRKYSDSLSHEAVVKLFFR